MHDLVIRGGTVVDGTGAEPRVADVAIDGDRIAAVGPSLPKGREEIDATGTTSSRRAMRSTRRFVRGRNANSTIATTTTKSRNAVPQRGCAVGYGAMRSGVSGSPCSNAWMVMCSAP